MRHRNKNKILDRKINQRKALIKSLVTSLIINERIKTTIARAKITAQQVDKLVTMSKNNTLSSRRYLLRYLTPIAAKKLISEIGPRFKDRNGGYTRILKLKRRKGDSAQIVVIEFV